MFVYQRYVKPFFNALRIFQRALGLVWQSSRTWTSLSIALNLLQAALPLGVLYCTKLLIDQLSSGPGSSYFSDGLPIVACLAGLWLLSGFLGSLQQWLEELQQLRFTDQIAGIIQVKSIQMDLAYYEDPALQDTFHKAQYESAYRPYQLLQAVYQLLQSAFFLLLAMGFLLSLAWWLVPFLILAALPVLVVKIRFAGRYYELDRRRAQQEREAWYLHELLTTVEAARELRLYRFGEIFAQRHQSIRTFLWGEKKQLLRRQLRYDLLGQISEILALLALLLWVVFKATAGLLSLGSVILYLQAFQRAQQQMRTALGAMTQLYSHRLFLNYLFDFLDLEPRVQEPLQPQILPHKLGGGFRVEGVFFQYPEQAQPVLQDINLELQLGERIAIVGPNGSGKSTLIKLLARFYDPDAGRILLAEHDLRELAQHDLRQHLSIVFQDFKHYPFSAADNIFISDLQHPADEQRMRQSAQRSGAATCIERLPEQYATRLGHDFEGGVELSGGQWQQVAIARAFYAESGILILDEPSSAIDPLIEQAIFDQFFASDPDRLIIFVTHRLYHLQRADRIIVMDQGRVVEQGDFARLMAQEGLFYRLFAAQQV